MGDAPVDSRKHTREEIQQAFEYANSVAGSYFHVFKRCGVSAEGLNFLELGPGQEFGAQLVLASMGAKVTLADPFLSEWDPDFHPELYRMLSENWPNANAELKKALAGQSHAATSLVLLREPAEALKSISDGCMDFVYSNAVLEHVVDMGRVAHELARVSKVGACSAHQIDWRDHHDFSRPLEHLALSDDDFLQVADADGWRFEYGNRLRSIEYRAFFESAGFEVIEVEINSRADSDYIANVLPRLRACRASSYANWPVDDLARIGGRFYVRKAQAGLAQRVKSSAEDIFLLVNAVKSPARQENPNGDVARDRAGADPLPSCRKSLFARVFNMK